MPQLNFPNFLTELLACEIREHPAYPNTAAEKDQEYVFLFLFVYLFILPLKASFSKCLGLPLGPKYLSLVTVIWNKGLHLAINCV